MAAKEQTFEDLLKDAPRAPDGSTISIVGALAKSDDPKKFVLFLSDGSSLTLDTAAVKKHAVLGQSVGQTIVQVDVDRDAATAAGATDHPLKLGIGNMGASEGAHANFTAGNLQSVPVVDMHLTFPGLDPIGTIFGTDQGGTLQENISDPGVDRDPGARASIFPFSMQTAHQVAGQQLEALNALAFGGQRTYLTAYDWTSDHRTIFKAWY